MVANGGGEGLPRGTERRRGLWVDPDGLVRGVVEVQRQHGVEAEPLKEVDRGGDARGERAR